MWTSAFDGPDADGRWHSVDWYLDLVDRVDAPLELVDVDELFDARAVGLLTTAECERAVAAATRALTGAAAAGSLQDWLDAQVGEPLTWRDTSRPTVPDSDE